MRHITAFFTLFTSMGTLFCCALPATFVLLGAGATFAGLTQNLPGLLWFGEHKTLLFVLGGIGNTIGLYTIRANEPVTCAIDGSEASPCETTRDWAKPMIYISSGLYAVGALFAYILPFFL